MGKGSDKDEVGGTGGSRPPSSMPSSRSPRGSGEVEEAQWIEVEGKDPAPPSGSPSPPSHPSPSPPPLVEPIDLVVDRVRPARGKGQAGRGRRDSHPHGYLSPVPAPPCVFCGEKSVTSIAVIGPLAVPLCARCSRLSRLALKLVK